MITLPNVLTVLRIAALVVFLVVFYLGYIKLAIVILITSSLTDLLDGLLARLLRQQTDLGSFLDPFADKLFIECTFFMLLLRNYIPWWLFLCVFIRDLFVVTGWGILKTRHGVRAKVVPRISGKLAVFFQMTTLIVVVLQMGFELKVLALLKPMFFYLTAMLTLFSLVDYLISAKKTLFMELSYREP